MTTETQPARPLLDVRSASISFKQQHGAMVHAVRSVSFAVGAGETVALVGESGSGKSSLARLVLCLTRPDSGEIHLAGERIDHLSNRELRTRRLLMQPVFQDASAAFNPRRTVMQSLEQALRCSATPPVDMRPAVEELLEQVRLFPASRLLNRFSHELSGGQRQRLGIARALAVNPRLIVADEPLSGADVSIRGQILDLLIEIQESRGIAYLFITHDMTLARAFAHRVLVMYKGEIVEQGTTEQIFAEPKNEYTKILVKAAASIDDVAA
ncbi:ATP-binding cassette domain-containing protein [Bradyrhizobium sp. dw_78]|uniref:ABC transporter ATP-binding protein n=1 Tax=Bradyrhizobium sp. dw_78 TaxID=2719793 RepID=UPI001BD55A8B|nr:ATP-binding cassette domain-containing protein [Bradyrhizobium sp. dw_78]